MFDDVLINICVLWEMHFSTILIPMRKNTHSNEKKYSL